MCGCVCVRACARARACVCVIDRVAWLSLWSLLVVVVKNPTPNYAHLLVVKVWFQNRRAKWKKRKKLTNVFRTPGALIPSTCLQSPFGSGSINDFYPSFGPTGPGCGPIPSHDPCYWPPPPTHPGGMPGHIMTSHRIDPFSGFSNGGSNSGGRQSVGVGVGGGGSSFVSHHQPFPTPCPPVGFGGYYSMAAAAAAAVAVSTNGNHSPGAGGSPPSLTGSSCGSVGGGLMYPVPVCTPSAYCGGGQVVPGCESPVGQLQQQQQQQQHHLAACNGGLTGGDVISGGDIWRGSSIATLRKKALEHQVTAAVNASGLVGFR